MSLAIAPGASFESVADGFATGLSTMGVRIRDNIGADAVARTTAGVVEDIVGSGIYRKPDCVAPTVAGQYTIVWDDGLGHYATEDLIVTSTILGAGLPSGVDLCLLADVRQQMETKATDTKLDAEIQRLITWASERIMQEVNRELAPASTGVTRTFPAAGRIVDTSPYDMRTVSAVVLDPDKTARTLTSGVDYKLHPIGTDRFGVYTELELGRHIDLRAYSYNFSETEIRVTGNWGFASVPGIASKACIDQVRAWLRAGAARAAYVDPEMGASAPNPGAYYGLAPSVRNTLRPLYRDPL